MYIARYYAILPLSLGFIGSVNGSTKNAEMSMRNTKASLTSSHPHLLAVKSLITIADGALAMGESFDVLQNSRAPIALWVTPDRKGAAVEEEAIESPNGDSSGICYISLCAKHLYIVLPLDPIQLD